MTVLHEGRHPGEGLMSEANFHRSRDNIVIASGSGKLIPGTVLGQISASKKYKPATATGSDGAETATTILLYPVNATSADVAVSAITRDAEWNIHTLAYDDSIDDDAKKAAAHEQLRGLGIIVR